MRIERTALITNALLLHGLLAAPLAWAVQLVVGYGLAEADCSAAGVRFGFDSTTWQIVLTALAAAYALSGLAVAGWLAYEEWRRDGDERGRIAFMATGGILVSTIFLLLILLGGIAASSLEPCHRA
jgi:hypothetical protein